MNTDTGTQEDKMTASRGTLTQSIATMGDRTRLFTMPAGCTGHIQVVRVGGGFRVQIGGKLTGSACIYPTADEAAAVVETGRHTGTGTKTS